eukprot:TRINITY_DN988_c0_g2_i2.p1 TRINITY_DN988_c0_g2~~TRINITY_DN988_c0_g2_i2.p1  ORF type:complete len:384 (+),score=156.63 TRINITY_DN988_c0_g2_i2:129-1280(+)
MDRQTSAASDLLGSVLDAEAAPAPAPAGGTDFPSEDDPNFALRLQLLEYEELEQSLPADLRPDESDLEARLALLRDIAAQQYMMEQHEGVAALLGGQLEGGDDMDIDEVGARALQQLGLTLEFDGDEAMEGTEEGDEGDEDAPRRPRMAGMANMADLASLLGSNLAGYLHTHLANAAVDVDAMSYEELLEMCDNVGTVNVGLNAEEIERRTLTFTYDAAMREKLTVDGQSPRCIVCMMDFEEGDELRKLSCPHVFHSECIDQWLDKSRYCPTCKTECTDRVPFPEAATPAPAPPLPPAVASPSPPPSTFAREHPQPSSSSSSPPVSAKKHRRAVAAATPPPQEDVPEAHGAAPPCTASAGAAAAPSEPKKRKKKTRSTMLAIR